MLPLELLASPPAARVASCACTFDNPATNNKIANTFSWFSFIFILLEINIMSFYILFPYTD